MSLKLLCAHWIGERRARRWTVATVAAVLVGTGALGTGLVRGLDPDAGAAPAGNSDVRQPAVPADHAAPKARHHSGTCPTGAVPGVVIDEVRTVPAPDAGLWLEPRAYRIVVRGHLANDTDAAIAVGRVRMTVGGRTWPARTQVPRSLAAESTGPVLVRGVFHSPSRQRLVIASHLSWGWRYPPKRPCGVSGLADDD